MCRTVCGVCHLSRLRGCPRAQAAYPPAMDEPPLTAGVFGLATHGMCGLRCRHRSRWALTPPFHPYRREDGGCFLSLIPGVAAGFPLGNMLLCVARTFLLQRDLQATDHTSACCLSLVAYSKSPVSSGRTLRSCRPRSRRGRGMNRWRGDSWKPVPSVGP